MRGVFINSKLYAVKETDNALHDNPIYKLENNSFQKRREEQEEDNQIYLALTSEPLIFLDNLNFRGKDFNPDLLIFASRHSSVTARPAFLVHSTGNWSSDNQFGGKPKDLSKTSALLHKAGFDALKSQIRENNFEGFSFDLEVTHHGPTKLDKPLIFMELGSSKQEWILKEAGEIVANSIIKTVANYSKLKKNKSQKVGLGFGGTHYAPNFNRLISNSNIALSFICPKYHIHELDEHLIGMMISNTLEKVDYFLIDWKGTNSADKKHLIPLLEKFDIPIRKTRSFSTVQN
jgi:D-aminoacyl-tRNA deacylase